jgi:hypothetical protein
VLGADLGAHLGVHQRLSQHPHAPAQEVDIGAVGPAQQLQQIHVVTAIAIVLSTC